MLVNKGKSNINLATIIVQIGLACLLPAACTNRQSPTISLTATRLVPIATLSTTENRPTLTPLPSQTTIPSATATPLQLPVATPSRTKQPARSPTVTISLHQNGEGTLTPSPTASLTLSIESQAAQNAEATMAGTWVARAATEEAILPGCISPWKHDYSPDGKWVALTCGNSATGVYRRDNPTLAWLLNPNDIFGEKLVEGGRYSVDPYHWTANGRYLYLSLNSCCKDPACSNYYTGEALIRLDLLMGKVTQTLRPGDAMMQMYYFTFSPDDTTLAYLRTWLPHPILNLENLVTGEEQHIPMGDVYTQAGDIVWSPDYQRIVFSANNGEGCENRTYYLVMMDLDHFKQRVLLKSSSTEYTPTQWTEDKQIIVDVGYTQGYITLDLATGRISPYLTPTPDGNP